MACGGAPVSQASVSYLATGRVDREGRLVEADEPLATLQRENGGEIGGTLAIPELRNIATRAVELGLRMSRSFNALGREERISGWIEAIPDYAGGGGCLLGIASWRAEAVQRGEEEQQLARVRRELDRALPEFSARLDRNQGVLTAASDAADMAELAADMAAGVGRPWTDFVTLPGAIEGQPLHWRLLDGAACEVAGSARRWTAWLDPLGMPEPGSDGFVLTLASEQAAPEVDRTAPAASSAIPSLGEELAPALREPIDRVITQAEAIRSRLAGPVADIYAGYAGDMIDAGQHLLALIEDIADLEGVDAPDFTVALVRIDLGEAARQACGILGVRAQGRGIVLVPPVPGESLWARGEFRRVLQILINLIGNAIAYSPEDSQVWIRLDRDGYRARVTVADQGRGLNAAEQARVFDKFERLGRSGDGGSGLGLHIGRRLARAMEGDLTVESAPGQGARFTLTLSAVD